MYKVGQYVKLHGIRKGHIVSLRADGRYTIKYEDSPNKVIVQENQIHPIDEIVYYVAGPNGAAIPVYK